MLAEQRQTGREWQRARRARLLRLNPKRPLALAAAARDAADHVLAPVGGDQRGELAARPLGLLEVARRHQAIGDAGRLVGPYHAVLHDGQLERMAPAAAVGIIELRADPDRKSVV